jgi:hypothetical protein
MTAPLDAEGPATPPRSNGELVFAEPWESRAFGMAVTLYEAGVFTWPRFQAAPIARIAAWRPHRPKVRAGTTISTGWAPWRMCSSARAPCPPTRSSHVPGPWPGAHPATTTPTTRACESGPIQGRPRDRLGGIIHEYAQVAWRG